jgi:hypothetical protein
MVAEPVKTGCAKCRIKFKSDCKPEVVVGAGDGRLLILLPLSRKASQLRAER